MDFDLSSLAAGFVFGVFGIYLIRIGKNEANLWHIAIGAGLIAYPYFVSGALLTWGVGCALLFLAYVQR